MGVLSGYGRVVLVSIASAALLATGCGDGDTANSSQAARSTLASEAAAFVKRANTACEKESELLLENLSDYVERHSRKGPPREVIADAVRSVLLPRVEAGISAIRRLEPPAGDEKKIAAMLAEQRQAVNELRAAEQLPSFTSAEQRFAEASKGLREYGFTACLWYE